MELFQWCGWWRSKYEDRQIPGSQDQHLFQTYMDDGEYAEVHEVCACFYEAIDIVEVKGNKLQIELEDLLARAAALKVAIEEKLEEIEAEIRDYKVAFPTYVDTILSAGKKILQVRQELARRGERLEGWAPVGIMRSVMKTWKRRNCLIRLL